MIHKVIHYCWFGGKRKPKLIRDCIKSWKRHMPDYEIIEWNEKNSDLNSLFVKEAYRLKMWAFVADYIRLKVLYENGGIYLDTDMMVLKSFNNILFDACFLGAEDDDFINGAVIGAVKNNVFIKECLSKYERIDVNNEMDWGQITIPRIITDTYRKKYNYHNTFDKIKKNEKIVIYPSRYFYPLPLKKKADIKNYKNYIKFNTFTVHLWVSSWFKYNEFDHIRYHQYGNAFVIILKNIVFKRKISYSYFKKIAFCIKESLYK